MRLILQTRRMKIIILVAGMSILVSLVSNAQDTRTHIEKALKDPKASENAAKADALLIDKTNIKYDSMQERRPRATTKEKSHYRKTNRISPKK